MILHSIYEEAGDDRSPKRSLPQRGVALRVLGYYYKAPVKTHLTSHFSLNGTGVLHKAVNSDKFGNGKRYSLGSP